MRTTIERDLVTKLKNDGLNFSQISSIIGISRHAARSLYTYQRVCHPKKTGPKPKLFKKDLLSIKRKISTYEENEEKINSSKIIRECKLNVSPITVQRYLKRVNYKYTTAKSEIILSKKHKQNRIDIISKWISDNHCWEKTIFSDEKRFSMDGPDDFRTYVKKSQKRIRQKRQCKGGGIMVWMMVLPNGLLAHRVITGRFSSKDYLNLLKGMVVPIMRLNFGKNVHFQEDNATVHKAKEIQTFMKINDINVLNWPAKSPDLNIAEDVWKIISDIIYDGRQYDRRDDLIMAINNCILDINTNKRQSICNLYETIRRRLCTVLNKNGNLYNK